MKIFETKYMSAGIVADWKVIKPDFLEADLTAYSGCDAKYNRPNYKYLYLVFGPKILLKKVFNKFSVVTIFYQSEGLNNCLRFALLVQS
ncbi:MAG: hypothetical protein IH964_13680 [Candidatus Dadabacteria bacterium]|nr:hypothetical protein [Candidatus Dadabacteria bacterium]